LEILLLHHGFQKTSRGEMHRLLRISGFAAAGLAVLALSGSAGVYGISARKLTKTYDVPPVSLAIPTDEAALERGRHLVNSLTSCQECHGLDLGGTVVVEPGPMGFVAAANLTSGSGGIGADYTVEDWVRAIRYGLRRDGTSLFIMPSESYAKVSDEDLGAMIAYLRTVPPVDREFEPPRLGPLGRVLLSAGQLDVMSAEKATRPIDRTPVEVAATVDYGRYIAGIGGCTSCHLPDLTGGLVIGPPGSPPSTNINPAGLAGWSEADFVRALREGVRPDGTAISESMPWRFSGKMTDEELHALWLYIQSMPAVATPAS